MKSQSLIDDSIEVGHGLQYFVIGQGRGIDHFRSELHNLGRIVGEMIED